MSHPCHTSTAANRYIYWSAESGIGRLDKDGTDPTWPFISIPSSAVVDLDVSATNIYWANAQAGAIGRANLDGTGVNGSFISGSFAHSVVATPD